MESTEKSMEDDQYKHPFPRHVRSTSDISAKSRGMIAHATAMRDIKVCLKCLHLREWTAAAAMAAFVADS